MAVLPATLGGSDSDREDASRESCSHWVLLSSDTETSIIDQAAANDAIPEMPIL
jgi:hypothetical protein